MGAESRLVRTSALGQRWGIISLFLNQPLALIIIDKLINYNQSSKVIFLESNWKKKVCCHRERLNWIALMVKWTQLFPFRKPWSTRDAQALPCPWRSAAVLPGAALLILIHNYTRTNTVCVSVSSHHNLHEIHIFNLSWSLIQKRTIGVLLSNQTNHHCYLCS